LIQGYAEVVDGVPPAAFERCLADMIRREGVTGERDLDPEALERLAGEFRELAVRLAGTSVPEDPRAQLRAAAAAVYRSWESPRAREYRRLNHLERLGGTAVTVQAMVYGNAGGASGAGVAFSRDPASGANALYVEYLPDAQGEDVVSGRRTPADAARLAARLPEVAARLAQGVQHLEGELRDVQDVEFTVEDGRLFFLQTRNAKRSPRAALRIAVDMVREGMIAPETALARLAGVDLAALAVTGFADQASPVASAIAAAPGVATGRIAFGAARAKELAAQAPVILVRPETSTDDVEGFAVAAGILTAVGGRTAHAAVVARQLGKVCLVGCRALAIDETRGEARIGGVCLREGDWLSLDGETGAITLGRRPIVRTPPPELAELERWRAQQSANAPRGEGQTLP
jgi:pyruvate,orthophosphate dikinase